MDPLIVDVYEGDLNGHPQWPLLVAAGAPWHGAILKATDGIHGTPAWFLREWPAVRAAAGDRYGVDFFRGAYHYFVAKRDAATQAQMFCDAVEAAGGWDAGDFAPFVDVEHKQNIGVSKAELEDGVATFVSYLVLRAGVQPNLYGNSLLADLGITSRLGCAKLWIARYTPDLPSVIYERIGWDRGSLFGWQYAGVGGQGEIQGGLVAGYPRTSPMGNVDITALQLGGGGDSALSVASGGLLKGKPSTLPALAALFGSIIAARRG